MVACGRGFTRLNDEGRIWSAVMMQRAKAGGVERSPREMGGRIAKHQQERAPPGPRASLGESVKRSQEGRITERPGPPLFPEREKRRSETESRRHLRMATDRPFPCVVPAPRGRECVLSFPLSPPGRIEDPPPPPLLINGLPPPFSISRIVWPYRRGILWPFSI